VVGRRMDEALDVAAAGEMLAYRAQDDDAHARVLVERFEHEAELVALRHRNDVERRPVEHDVRALLLGIDLDPETVECAKARIGEGIGLRHSAVPRAGVSGSYSAATSLRRSSLPTGDFGMASTNT